VVRREGEERENDGDGSIGNRKGEKNRKWERERERERERDLSCFIINTIAVKKPVEQVLSSKVCF